MAGRILQIIIILYTYLTTYFRCKSMYYFSRNISSLHYSLFQIPTVWANVLTNFFKLINTYSIIVQYLNCSQFVLIVDTKHIVIAINVYSFVNSFVNSILGYLNTFIHNLYKGLYKVLTYISDLCRNVKRTTTHCLVH